MEMLIAGLVLWCGTHFVPTLGHGLKAAVVKRIGTQPYQLIIALMIVSALALMYGGWISVDPVYVYDPPTWGVYVNTVLMVVSSYLFMASQLPTRLRQCVRHPMLWGLVVWGLAHLLISGGVHSLVLFGGLSVWALAEMYLINARDGQWVKPAPSSLKSDVISVVATAVSMAVIAYLHTLVGVSPFPYM